VASGADRAIVIPDFPRVPHIPLIRERRTRTVPSTRLHLPNPNCPKLSQRETAPWRVERSLLVWSRARHESPSSRK
jgi:hypothetical protein